MRMVPNYGTKHTCANHHAPKIKLHVLKVNIVVGELKQEFGIHASECAAQAHDDHDDEACARIITCVTGVTFNPRSRHHHTNCQKYHTAPLYHFLRPSQEKSEHHCCANDLHVGKHLILCSIDIVQNTADQKVQ